MSRFLIMPSEGSHFIVEAKNAGDAIRHATKQKIAVLDEIEMVRRIDDADEDGERTPAFTMCFDDTEDSDTFITTMHIHKKASGHDLLALLKQGVRGMISSGARIGQTTEKEILAYIFEFDNEEVDEAKH